jgi:hypothetical protein
MIKSLKNGGTLGRGNCRRKLNYGLIFPLPESVSPIIPNVFYNLIENSVLNSAMCRDKVLVFQSVKTLLGREVICMEGT